LFLGLLGPLESKFDKSVMCWNALHVEKQRKLAYYGDLPKIEALSVVIMAGAGAHC
jgi:hypothetical protein